MFPVKHEQIFKNGIKCIHKVPFQNKCTDRSMDEGTTGPRRFIRWHRKVSVMIVVVVVVAE